VAGLLAAGLVSSGGVGASASVGRSAANGGIPVAREGAGTATPWSVQVRDFDDEQEPHEQKPRGQEQIGPLGLDGKPAGGGLPSQPSAGTKPALAAPDTKAGQGTGANVGPTPEWSTGSRTAPITVSANFDGVAQGASDCGNCRSPDPSAAVGLTQIAHTANLRLQVYDKSGGALCGVGLTRILGATTPLASPRVQYDNLNDRYSMIVVPIPATTDATPAMYVAASKSGDACGGWWIYRITFSGPMYPKGTLLDYPYLGQDSVAILSSSNNFVRTAAGGFEYSNSAAFSIPKSKLYVGVEFSLSAFRVEFSAAPVTVAGIPVVATDNAYFVASVPGVGYRLYRMTDSAGTGTALMLQATVKSPFSAPTRRVNQPNSSQTLDPLDGRITWAPVQEGKFVWFAHGVDIDGSPGVRYGAISTASNIAIVAAASHSRTSDDFNPSIGVGVAGNNTNYIFLNWSYTDTPANIPASVTVNGVFPGAGVPNLTGDSLVLVNGASTSSNDRFGDISSVAIDPTSASGCTAVTAQEYFGPDGQWRTRLSRVAFC
jgi:hypothetical protein